MRDWGGGVTYLDTIQEIFLLCCLSLSDSWIRLVIFNLFLRIFLDGRTSCYPSLALARLKGSCWHPF